MRICTNVIIIVILLFSVNTAVADPFVELISISGDNLQGNLQHGWIHSDLIKVKINNQEIPVQNGHFILGFDRDAPLDNFLTIIMIDGDSLSLSYPIDKRNYQIDRINNLEKTYVSGSSD